jgi:predicted phosphodiesterase
VSPRELVPVLFVPDTHVPYHDERAWQLMLEVGRRLKPGVVCHLGDLGDFYKISSHSKDPRRQLSFEQEIADCKAKRAELDALKAKRKIFCEGNHEDRLRRYLADKAPELFGMVDTDQLLGLTENGWEFVPYKQDTKIGKVYVTHDVGYAGKYAARRVADTYHHSAVTAHTHRLEYLVVGDATGERFVSVVPGWLGDWRKVDYQHRLKTAVDWSLGFAVGWLDESTGHMHIQPVPIVDYACVVAGRHYSN